MARRPRPLSEHDRATWHAFARDIARLPGTAPLADPAPPPKAAAPPPAPPAAAPAVVRHRRAAPAELVTGIAPAGLDRSSWNRFHGGRLAPTRTLDLHGKTAQAAFHALERFLHAASADQVRCVEIITGRGSGEGGGVIRREMPFWLNLAGLRPLILAAAHPHAGNPGATRLLLRRRR
jgi:DNA-nicking Smr family endonuclease